MTHTVITPQIGYIKTKESEQKTYDISYNFLIIGHIFFIGWKNLDKTMSAFKNVILKSLPLK